MRAMSKHHQGEAAHPVLHKDVLRLARVALRCRGAAGQGQLKLTGRTIQDAAVFSTSCGTRLWSMARCGLIVIAVPLLSALAMFFPSTILLPHRHLA